VGPVEPPKHSLDASAFQMLDQLPGDRHAIFHAGFVTGALAKPLESLALLEQGEGQAIGKVVWGCFLRCP
jgi:hypothetical protein